MAGYVGSDDVHGDVRALVLDDETSDVGSPIFNTNTKTPLNKADLDEQSLRNPAWTKNTSIEPTSVPRLGLPSASSSTVSSFPLSSPASKMQMGQAPVQPGDLSETNKIIIGSITAAAIIAMLGAVAYWLHRRETLRRRPRASSSMPPFSPPLSQEDEKLQNVVIYKELGWVAVKYPAKADSPKASFDSGLGIVLGTEEQKTSTPVKAGRKPLQIDTQLSNVGIRKPGGPLSSNPTAEEDFGFPLERSPAPLVLEVIQEDDFENMEPLPAMGDGALTAKASRESFTVIETMQPASPKHRQLTPTKSILKSSSTSPAAVEGPAIEPVTVMTPGSPKSSKRSALKKQVSSLVKPKKEVKILLAEEAPKATPPTSPTSPSGPRKGVSFGEDVVRRISYSPDIDEGDWQTIDSGTAEEGEVNKMSL